MNNSHTGEEAIMEIFSTLATAWDTADSELFSAVFSEDADYVTFMGQHLKGRTEIARAHHLLWQGFLKGSKLVSTEPPSIRFINESLAIAHGTGAVLTRWQKKPSSKRLSINTNVLVKEEGRWHIVAFHNCRIQKLPWFIRLFVKDAS